MSSGRSSLDSDEYDARDGGEGLANAALSQLEEPSANRQPGEVPPQVTVSNSFSDTRLILNVLSPLNPRYNPSSPASPSSSAKTDPDSDSDDEQQATIDASNAKAASYHEKIVAEILAETPGHPPSLQPSPLIRSPS